MSHEADDTGAAGAAAETDGGLPAPVPTTVGWKADPVGRFDARYWNGEAWTEQVLDSQGQLGADAEPLADPARWLPREPVVIVPPPPATVVVPTPTLPPPPRGPVSPYPAQPQAKKPMSGWKIFGLVCLSLVVLVIGLGLLAFFTVVKPSFDEANGYLHDLQARDLKAAQQRMCNAAVSDPTSDLAHLDAVDWQGRYDLTQIGAMRGSSHISTVRGTVGANTTVIVHLGDNECILGIEIPGLPNATPTQ
jgi:hypothetical protein